MNPAAPSPTPYKLAVLVFIENESEEQLLMLRNRQPNYGNWSPIGGKLETAIGESPFECAARETHEETGMEVTPGDFHLFAMIAEKAYEGEAHWLLFLFRCRKRIQSLPPDIDEGSFAFFKRGDLERLHIPETDRKALWPLWDQFREQFIALRVDCTPSRELKVEIEQVSPAVN